MAILICGVQSLENLSEAYERASRKGEIIQEDRKTFIDIPSFFSSAPSMIGRNLVGYSDCIRLLACLLAFADVGTCGKTQN